MRHINLLTGLILLPYYLTSQPVFPDDEPVFKDDVVPRIDIFIHPDTLQWIYENVESYQEFHATFVFDNETIRDTIENIGFRLRGNTSRYSQKKSFKVSFNTFEPGRKWNGLEKLNLNGEHNDPSIVRAKLCWDLLRELEIPAPRSNHVQVYINNNYYGLYINTEHIDEEFVASRFGNKDGNLYKCLWPADLDYLGQNPEYYKLTNGGSRRVYDLRTNVAEDDYSDIAHFIDVLNNTPSNQFICEMDKVFNLYDYLKIVAADIFTGNWDGYIYNKNNFYLYHNTETGKFEYIPYDLDNTFGIDWVDRDWGTRDIYDWEQHGDEVRPLYTRIMAIPELKDQFTYYLNLLTTTFASEEDFYPVIDATRDKIAPYVINDPYYPLDYGYTYSDFLNSYTSALGGHVGYGLKPYVHVRDSSNLAQIELTDIEPVIKYVGHSAFLPGQDFTVTAYAEDEDETPEVKLVYRLNNGALQFLYMYDDGEHNDGEEGDKIYGGTISGITNSTSIEFQVSVTDNFGYNSIKPCDPLELNLFPSTDPELYINEFMASNDGAFADEFGEYDDWIELFNGDDVPVWLGDKSLSDNPDIPYKWPMPDITLQPGGFILFWADDDPEQGIKHTNFKLKEEGDEIGIYDSESTGFYPIDTVVFSAQAADISFGRDPDGDSAWKYYTVITPGLSNSGGANVDEHKNESFLTIYPNPVADNSVYLEEPMNLKVFDGTGSLILELYNVNKISTDGLKPGFYLVVNEKGMRAKLIIQ
jgi:hypothetical protein